MQNAAFEILQSFAGENSMGRLMSGIEELIKKDALKVRGALVKNNNKRLC
ncbi:hypothetical protein M3627_07915 [Psychrobacillus sp. MER TA 171]|nr:hypothetical protein [Psychrobacillus sp. MER TA 171]